MLALCLALPAQAEVYTSSPEYTNQTMPEGLSRDHRTRAGTWGRIVVRDGKLMYSLIDPKVPAWVLRPGIDGIIAPGLSHWLAARGDVRFVVEFLRLPAN